MLGAMHGMTTGQAARRRLSPPQCRNRRTPERAEVPHPEGGVCHRENNCEYALDAYVGDGNFYAFEAGQAHLSYWANGIGIDSDGTEDPEWLCRRLSDYLLCYTGPTS